ncbi:GNAT family N-acetyltransferase [Clostridium botulinum]|nr:GNAT family N-acetyltransferase [Clostridium botulinum]NFL38239.1 GNAT family N-acetyltransferase [Clostridium botulinum]NFL64718.1 GNAT family N-acetyltransferase [Clostridium botulinum]NFN08034.1 GNAT family N-acetyltransferase [Clostridium botulinum]NFN24233.1 GNAT family N-acetyltransferase [Clostridium botulinum]
MEREDLELMKEMLNDSEIEKLVVGWSFPVSSYQQNKWYETNIENNNNLRFIIETEDDGAVGLATLTNIDWKNRRANHGIKLANKKNRTKGIGTDTVMAVMRYAFDELQLNRLDGSWFEDNKASKRLYEKCGWNTEGIRKQYIYKGGKYRDLAITGILADEYYKLIENTHYWN